MIYAKRCQKCGNDFTFTEQQIGRLSQTEQLICAKEGLDFASMVKVTCVHCNTQSLAPRSQLRVVEAPLEGASEIEQKLQSLVAQVDELARSGFDTPGPLFTAERKQSFTNWFGNFGRNLQAVSTALATGKDMAGNPMSRAQAADGLERMCLEYSKMLSRLQEVCGEPVRRRFEGMMAETTALADTLRGSVPPPKAAAAPIAVPTPPPVLTPDPRIDELIQSMTKPQPQSMDLIHMEPSAMAAEFVKRAHQVRQNAALGLVTLGAPAVLPLAEQLKHPQQVVRVLAATSLGAMKDVRAVPSLIDVLGDTDAVVRSSAAEALGTIGDKRAVEPLAPLLQDAEFSVRKAAADATGKLTGTRPKVKGACFVATATLGSPHHPDVLLLQDFRDHYLERKRRGRQIIAAYNRWSPPLAYCIAHHDSLKLLSYWLVIAPLVWAVRVFWWKGVGQQR